MNDSEFTTPPAHIHFKAKKFPELAGTFRDGALAFLEPGGGGPLGKHSHTPDHLFLVVSGEARVEYENETVVIPAGTTCRVTGRRPHAVWNNTNQQTVMLGLTI